MLGQNDIMIKMARTEEYIDEEGNSRINYFLEHVIRSQSSFSSDDCYVSEVLTHVDLLERTIRLPLQLAAIVTVNETDKKRLHDLRLVFTELLEKFS